MGAIRDAIREQREAAKVANADKPRVTLSERATGVDKYLTPYAGERWEYAVINFVDRWSDLNDIRSQLDRMGAHGWELCERRDEGTGMTRQGGGFVTFIFKRRRLAG